MGLVCEGEWSGRVETIFAIGGGQIYRKCLEYPAGILDRLYLTRVYSDVKCDVFLEPESFLDGFSLVAENGEDKENFGVEFNRMQRDEKSQIEYCFEVYEKVE